MTLVTALLLVFGVLVFVLAGYFLRQQNQKTLTGPGRDHYWDSQTAASAQVFENLFEPRDLEYVQQKCPAEVVALFRFERKRLVLLWLREIRLEAARSLESHAQRARTSKSLEPQTELKIALRYWCLCWACALAWAMVQLLGPFRASAVVRFTSRLSNALSVIAAPASWRDAGRSS